MEWWCGKGARGGYLKGVRGGYLKGVRGGYLKGVPHPSPPPLYIGGG